MITEKLAIARGYQRAAESAPVLALVPPPPTEPALGDDYRWAHERMAALERLAALFERGVISQLEFTAEKALILQRPIDESADPPKLEAKPDRRGPSLGERLIRWQLIPVGIASGLAFSYATQPRETLRFFDQLVRMVGA